MNDTPVPRGTASAVHGNSAPSVPAANEAEALAITIIGVGRVGLITAVTLVRLGHHVTGLDADRETIAALSRGRAPYYEPGLTELLDEGISSGKLGFVSDPERAIPGSTVCFICVGTPGRVTGEPNLLAVEQAATATGRFASVDMVVVEKSTVPVQTADRIKTILARSSHYQFDVVSNPEFLREGSALEDSLGPQRILVGADTPRAHEVMRTVYAPLIARGIPYYATDVRTAELAKHSCNAFLALKISFANALAQICEAAGADVVRIADIMGSDPRIGREFLDAGLGYGGSCFPKDLAAFRAQAGRLGYQFRLLDEVTRINEEALEATIAKVLEAVWNLEGKRIALLGLSFKPGTDDIRESPALALARRLIGAGALVVGYDPKANANSRRELPDLETVQDPYAAIEGAHCVVICTGWPAFASLDLARIKGIMSHPVLIDARNVLDPDAVAESGLAYLPTGRPPVNL